MRARFKESWTALNPASVFWLPSVSVSPYIGLFGTVWGIMDAFTGLGNLESASLAVVAPGIAEALVATAIGLLLLFLLLLDTTDLLYSIDQLIHPIRELHARIPKHSQPSKLIGV